MAHLAVLPVAAQACPVLGVLKRLVQVGPPGALLGHVQPAVPVILMTPPTSETTRHERHEGLYIPAEENEKRPGGRRWGSRIGQKVNKRREN